MWNDAFEGLRRRLTIIYTAIFSTIIIAILGAAYTFIWWEIVSHEKEELVAQAYHEAEEWLNSGELPCSQTSLKDGSMFAYFVTMDNKNVILEQLGSGPEGRAIYSHKNDWPKELESTRILRMHGVDNNASNERYRYLSAVVPVKKDKTVIGKLYMFKNIEFYYNAAYKTLFILLCIAFMLVLGACGISYWLAGINISPIKNMYEKQKQFTADASHEMRTPLSVMKLAVTALQEDEESRYSSFANDSLQMLGNEVNSMSRLIQRLMELARGEQADEPLLWERMDLSGLCEAVNMQMELLAKNKDIELASFIEPNLYLRGDGESIKRLLVILLDNAIKYSPCNSKITLRLFKNNKHIRIEVADEGEGIKDDDKKRVFDRFYRVDKARSRSQGGFGLGLSLAQEIAKQHGAVITIKDNKPSGTIMQVTFKTIIS